MRERHVPRPLPEGSHGQFPEGKRGEPKPIERLHESAKSVFDRDPDVYTKKIGEVRTKLPNNSTLVIEALTQDTVDEWYDSHRISYYEKFPNGRVIPLTSIYLDESGVLQRDDSAYKRARLLTSLDEFEQARGLQQVDPVTGEMVESELRKVLEAEAISRFGAEEEENLELGLSAVSDQEAVAVLQAYQQVFPSWPKDIRLPEKGEIGQPQEETIQAFKRVTESIARDEVVQFSNWKDNEGAEYTLSSHSLIAEDGTEIPNDISLERVVTETEGMMASTATTVWKGERRGTFRTGSYEQILTSPKGESYTPQVRTLNKAATVAFKAHMASPESDASAEALDTVVQLISTRAEQLEQQQAKKDHPEEQGPEISALTTPTSRVDVVVFQEPQVEEASTSSISDQEKAIDTNKANIHRKGKSK